MKRYLLSIFYVFVALVSVSAQVSLDSCRSWACCNYPVAKQYDLISCMESFSISNASRLWLPRVVLSSQGSWQSDAVGMGDLLKSGALGPMSAIMGELPDLYMRQWQGKVQLEVQQPIWDGGASSAQKQLIQTETAVQKAQIDIELKRLEERVDQIFFAILLVEEQTKQIRSIEQLLQSNLKTAQALCQNEVLLPSDVDAVEAELLSVGQRLVQLSYGLSSYRQMLSLLCGRDLTGEELVPPVVQTEQRKPLVRNMLFEAQQQSLVARKSALVASIMPHIGAFAQGWYGYPKLNMFESMQSGEWGLSAIVGLSLRWNIGSLYTFKNDSRKLSVAVQQVDVQRETFNYNHQLKDVQDDAEVGRLREMLVADERIVQLRTSIRKAAESKYQYGTITTSELLQKVNDETQAACAMVLHRIELQSKICEIYK